MLTDSRKQAELHKHYRLYIGVIVAVCNFHETSFIGCMVSQSSQFVFKTILIILRLRFYLELNLKRS